MSEYKKDQATRRWHAAAHAVQSGVAADMASGGGTPSTQAKHLRTGINMAQADQAGLAALLIRKGLITELEFLEAIAESAEREKARYEAFLSEKTGRPVTLA